MRALRDACESKGGAFVPIYGRRRVGKSALIAEFLRRHRGIYYLGKQVPTDMQQREFLQEAAVALDEPSLATQSVGNWQDIIRVVLSFWKGPGKLVLAFDEFQWTVAASPELPSVLQGMWDQNWRDSGQVMLILCGSYIGFMERELLGRKSPLFGRRTAQIHLRPFSYHEAALFHPSLSTADRAAVYFVCGGIPQYLAYFDAHRSVEQNIEQQLLAPASSLWSEADFLLREELRDVDRYYAILSAIANGSMTHIQIARKAGLDPRAMDYYLRHLVELGYITRRYPLTGRVPGKRLTRYAIDDALLRFWFRFVQPNSSFALKMGPEAVFRERIRPHLDSYFGTCFERLCREALPDLYLQEGVRAAFEIGEYWSDQVQIDVVGMRDDNCTDLGECKWGGLRMAEAASELHARAALFPNPRGASIGLRLFLRHKPARAHVPPGVRCHTLDELYAAAR